jgi:predicted ester cyclase
MENNNKAVVLRFNKEVIEQGNPESFKELMDDNFINHTALPGINNGIDGMRYVFNEILRPAFSDLKVTIYDQIAEGDKVTTRKAITGTHTGELMGIAPTGQKVTINVIDIVTIKNGRYFEHWGINTLSAVIAQLSRL